MNFQNKLEQLIDAYLNESDKRNIQHIAIDVPGHKAQFFITDAAILDLAKPRADFSLTIYFSFNGETRQGQKLKEKIARNTELSKFEMRQAGKNTIGYNLEMPNDKSGVVKMVGLVVQTLSSGIDLATIGAEFKKINWHTLEK